MSDLLMLWFPSSFFSGWVKSRCSVTLSYPVQTLGWKQKLRGSGLLAEVPSWQRRGRWRWRRWPVGGSTQPTGPGFQGHLCVLPTYCCQRGCWWLHEASTGRGGSKGVSSPEMLGTSSFQRTDSPSRFSRVPLLFTQGRILPLGKKSTCAQKPKGHQYCFLFSMHPGPSLVPVMGSVTWLPPQGPLRADLSSHELTHSWWKGERGDDEGDDPWIQQAAEKGMEWIVSWISPTHGGQHAGPRQAAVSCSPT